MNPRRTDSSSHFIRKVIAKNACLRKHGDPSRYSLARWGADSPVWITERAAVGATTTFSDDDFSHGETAAYLDLVVEQSAVGRLGLRRVPLDSRVTSVDVGALAHWVGQSQGKPVSKMSLSAAPLTHKKVVALCVVANEVLNSNSPEAENLIKADLARAASAAWDEKFLSDDAASDAEPAGVLAGVAAETAVTDIPQSLSLLMANFSGDLSRAVFVARPATLALMTGTAFPQLGIRGGLLLGAPVIATNAAPEAQLLLIDPLRIAIGMSGIEVDTSRNTNIEMDDSPSGSGTDEGSPAITGVSTVSMFQANAVALKAEIWTNWHAATGAVAVLDASAWAGGSP